MFRICLMIIAVCAASAAAQDAGDGAPPFDPAIASACLSGNQGVARQVCIGVAAARCMDSDAGSTTVGMSYCLGEELDYWDSRLNAAYAKVMAAAETTDAEMVELGSAAPKQAPLLKQMQQDWIAYRDSACSYEGSRWGGGTGAGPAGVDCALVLTARQALWLEDYRDADADEDIR